MHPQTIPLVHGAEVKSTERETNERGSRPPLCSRVACCLLSLET